MAPLAELLRMEDERAFDAARAPGLVRHPHPEVRARAALAAGRIGDGSARPLLLESLSDSLPAVRASAAFALGRLGDTSAVVVQALARLLPAADTAAIEATSALARLNTPAAFAAVHALLRADPARVTDLPLVREALLALWRFSPRPGAAETALAWTRHADPGVRWAAVYNFARGAPPASAIPRLLELLADPDALVRATAARTLRPVQADSAGQGALARAALARALADAHPHVRINAVRALAAFRDPADAPAIVALTRDPDGNVRTAAAEGLGMVPGPAAAAALRALAGDAAAPLALRSAALASLARADSAGALEVATRWVEGTAWRQRLYAARALAALRDPAAKQALHRLAADADPRVQGEAYGALAADTTGAHDSFLLEGLGSPDPLVRAAAAAGLGRRGNAAYLSALMQAYDRAQRDTINDAALAAVDALHRLAQAGAPVAASFFFRFQPSRDPIVRERVARHFGAGSDTWGPARPVRTGRTPAFYQRVVRELVLPPLAGQPAPRVRIRTARGDIVLELASAHAPLTVRNFLALIESGFYARVDGLRWHRVVPNFVLQDGDPRGDGSGGPPDVIRDEINTLRYERGVLGMALSGPDTGGSQFFITHSPQPHLDGGYTVFGRVVAGLEVADAILQDDAIVAIERVP